MRATLMYGAGDVRVENVPDPTLQQPTDALVRVVRACICGSDLHPYHSMPASPSGSPMGHEFIGVVEDDRLRRDHRASRRLRRSPRSPGPTTPATFCREGLHTSCRARRLLGRQRIDGGRPRPSACRWPTAPSSRLPVGEDSALLPSLLTLSDVFGTGHHAAVHGGRQRRAPRSPSSATARSACSRCSRPSGWAPSRSSSWAGTRTAPTSAASSAPPTSSPSAARRASRRSASSPAATARTRVLEASATCPPTSRPSASSAPAASSAGSASRSTRRRRSASAACSAATSPSPAAPAPVRAYIEELLPDVLDGTIEPGKVFDRTVDLDGVPDGYRAMDDREALKVLVRP